MITIHLQRAIREPRLPHAALVHRWLRTSIKWLNHWHDAHLARVADSFQITLRWVKATEGQQLNHRYRGKDYPTNVLSFASEALPLGDIVLCAPVIIAQAQQYQRPLHDHCAHLILHGLLHLLGYDHLDARDRQVMEALEIALLAKLNIANPY